MPEEKEERTEQSPAPQQDQPQEQAVEESASPRRKKRAAVHCSPFLYTVVILLFVFVVGLGAYIGLNLYQNKLISQAYEARYAEAQEQMQSYSTTYSYSGPNIKIVDGEVVWRSSDSPQTAAPDTDTSTEPLP